MIILQKVIYRSDLLMNPNVFYVFGDNEERRGFKGQAAEMRGEPNAIGFRTKKAPSSSFYAFWRDKEFERLKPLIDEDIAVIRSKLEAGHIVVFPSDGVGTGLSALPKNAPRTFDYMCEQVRALRAIRP
jgi:hypothetical protein